MRGASLSTSCTAARIPHPPPHWHMYRPVCWSSRIETTSRSKLRWTVLHFHVRTWPSVTWAEILLSDGYDGYLLVLAHILVHPQKGTLYSRDRNSFGFSTKIIANAEGPSICWWSQESRHTKCFGKAYVLGSCLSDLTLSYTETRGQCHLPFLFREGSTFLPYIAFTTCCSRLVNGRCDPDTRVIRRKSYRLGLALYCASPNFQLQQFST